MYTLFTLLIGFVLAQNEDQYQLILKNIHSTRLGMCGCQIATVESQCYGPCAWSNNQCAKDEKFLSPTEEEGFKAESSGDMKMSDSCENYFDQEACLAQRYHDGLFCKWEESECVPTDCSSYGPEECLFIYFCKMGETVCERCAGEAMSSTVLSILGLLVMMVCY